MISGFEGVDESQCKRSCLGRVMSRQCVKNGAALTFRQGIPLQLLLHITSTDMLQGLWLPSEPHCWHP